MSETLAGSTVVQVVLGSAVWGCLEIPPARGATYTILTTCYTKRLAEGVHVVRAAWLSLRGRSSERTRQQVAVTACRFAVSGPLTVHMPCLHTDLWFLLTLTQPARRRSRSLSAGSEVQHTSSY